MSWGPKLMNLLGYIRVIMFEWLFLLILCKKKCPNFVFAPPCWLLQDKLRNQIGLFGESFLGFGLHFSKCGTHGAYQISSAMSFPIYHRAPFSTNPLEAWMVFHIEDPFLVLGTCHNSRPSCI